MGTESEDCERKRSDNEKSEPETSGNSILRSFSCTIETGRQNTIAYSVKSVISGGARNQIAGGSENKITGGSFNVILGGFGNRIGPDK